jgi:hypothetical protein
MATPAAEGVVAAVFPTAGVRAPPATELGAAVAVAVLKKLL